MHASEVAATVESTDYLDFVEQQLLTVISKEEAQDLIVETGVFRGTNRRDFRGFAVRVYDKNNVLVTSKRFSPNRDPQGVLTKLAIKKLARKARKR